MDERKWLADDDMLNLLDHANRCASNRKLRLFACACCRRFHDLLPTRAIQRALEISECVADGLASFAELLAAKRAIAVLQPRNASEWASNCAHFAATRSARNAALSAYSTSAEVVRALGLDCESHEHYYAVLLRDLLGNPFRAIPLNPTWRTPTVLALAKATYDDRQLPAGTLDLDRLMVLADSLEEAGCTSSAILGHLRGPKFHVRGCWVIDGLLGNK